MKKVINNIKRNHSVVSYKENLERLYTFKNFPIFMGCTDEPSEDDMFMDMTWTIDRDSGLVQLLHLVPLEILYSKQHMDATGATWDKYNNLLAKFISTEYKGDILEIGGGSGKLAQKVTSMEDSLKYFIVEPNPLIKETDRIKIIKSFFSNKIKNKENKIGTVTLSQVLEHAYDPEEFLTEIRNFLPDDGIFIFGYPNLEYFFSNKHTNAINFEHTMLMTDYYVDYFLSKTGFKILKKESFGNHSFFYSVQKVNEIKQIKTDVSSTFKGKYEKYKKMFNDFIVYHEDMIEEINSKIQSHDGDIYLFGAHIFSQYLISFGLSTEKVICILDNSPIKIGKRLYGTNLKVNSPKILSDSSNPLVILKAGVYNEEIKTGILTNINSKTKFI
ncbi:MAG: methyltransferase domain-containing protein [Flavobacteriaceae bacterium]|nr:methyltransferase domain-containing protein [Flavobacteriaceae bacterium]